MSANNEVTTGNIPPVDEFDEDDEAIDWGAVVDAEQELVSRVVATSGAPQQISPAIVYNPVNSKRKNLPRTFVEGDEAPAKKSRSRSNFQTHHARTTHTTQSRYVRANTDRVVHAHVQ